MSGFAIQKDQQQQDRLYYKLSSTQGTTTYRFITPVQNYINFPDVISNARIEKLSEPFLEEIDSRIYNEEIRTVDDLIATLKNYAADPDGLEFAWRSTPARYRGFVREYVEEYLNECTGMRDVVALVLKMENLPDDTRPAAFHTPEFVLTSPDNGEDEEKSELYLCISGITARSHFVEQRHLISIGDVKSGTSVGSSPYDDL